MCLVYHQAHQGLKVLRGTLKQTVLHLTHLSIYTLRTKSVKMVLADLPHTEQ